MKKLYLIGLVVIIILAGAFIIQSIYFEEDIPSKDWLVDNCDCIERNNFRCLNGFELDAENRLCRGDGSVTNVILGCSKYNCTGEVYEVK
ncbi:hypothetical protein GOV13_02315 [Candidatus Pacearchaeota archaeon]|nr:hypothetical protein [Candidatus Pacearchaeota archaeon]